MNFHRVVTHKFTVVNFRQTTSEELYPMNSEPTALVPSGTQQVLELSSKISPEVDPDFYFPKSLDDDVNLWSVDDVLRFLRLSGLEDICSKFFYFINFSISEII
jgi:hypothetical protein